MTDTNLPISSDDSEAHSERPTASSESFTPRSPWPAPDAAGATGAAGAARSGQTVLVSVNSPEEFLAELRDRPPNIDGVLRLNVRWHADESGAPRHYLW